MVRNRRQPPGGIAGEVLSPHDQPMRTSPREVYRQPDLPVHSDFQGVLNITARLRAWGAAKGYQSLAKMLDQYDAAITSQTRLAKSIERLEIQEERLHPQNMEILREAERRNVDTELENAATRYNEAAVRRRQSELRMEISEEDLQTELIQARRRRRLELERDMPAPQPAAPIALIEHSNDPTEATVQEKLAKVMEPLLQAEQRLLAGREDGSLLESEEAALNTEISAYLGEMEQIRNDHVGS